jgi:hypothetical protein
MKQECWNLFKSFTSWQNKVDGTPHQQARFADFAIAASSEGVQLVMGAGVQPSRMSKPVSCIRHQFAGAEMGFQSRRESKELKHLCLQP